MGWQLGERTRDGSLVSVEEEEDGMASGKRTGEGSLLSGEEEEDGMAIGRADC